MIGPLARPPLFNAAIRIHEERKHIYIISKEPLVILITRKVYLYLNFTGLKVSQ